MLYLFALVYGFAIGGTTPTMVALVSDISGLRKIGTALGVLEFCFGIGAAIGPYVAGFIFDVSGSYFMAFLSGALIILSRTLVIVLIRHGAGEN